MKFSAHSDMDVIADRVFPTLADFERHERAVLRRGVHVERVDALVDQPVGATWSARVRLRGRYREIKVSVDRFEPPESICYAVRGSGLAGHFTLDLVALSRTGCRLMVALELRPVNLSGRVVLRSLRLVKPTLNRRFKNRVAEYATYLRDQIAT